jgi:hypothetical protein
MLLFLAALSRSDNLFNTTDPFEPSEKFHPSATLTSRPPTAMPTTGSPDDGQAENAIAAPSLLLILICVILFGIVAVLGICGCRRLRRRRRPRRLDDDDGGGDQPLLVPSEEF